MIAFPATKAARSMDIATLYFYETVTCGSMRAASDKLGVSVSAISRQLSMLEHELGVLLIERNRRTIRLTEAGRICIEYHRNGVADRDALIEKVTMLRGGRGGRISIAVGEGFLSKELIDMLARHQQATEGVEVTLTIESTNDAIRHVLEDEVHIAFVFQAPLESKIHLLAAVAQPLLIACNPQHALASRASVNLHDIRGQALALPPRATRIRQLLAVAEAKNHIWLKPQITSNSIFTLRELAKAGGFITVLPKVSIREDVSNGSLIALPIAEPDLESADMSVITRAGRDLGSAAAALLPMLKEHLLSFG
jgi:DNA-binding transcriptional LysR family regulator